VLAELCGLRERAILHEGMWEAHFAAIDDAIAHAFDKGEDVVVFGVEDNALKRGFDSV
jgi:hypothetical protein